MQDWYDLKSKCPAFDCESPYNGIYWVHTQCEENEKINANGMIQCLKDKRIQNCLNPTFILELSFKCKGDKHINYKKVEGEKFLDAIFIAMKITSLPKKIRRELVDKINHYDDD